MKGCRCAGCCAERVGEVPYAYVDQLSDSDIETIKGRNIVGCDPGKFSLVYMSDDTSKLRYNARQRRTETKLTKNSKILLTEKRKHGVHEVEATLSEHNARTVDVERFKDYLRQKKPGQRPAPILLLRGRASEDEMEAVRLRSKKRRQVSKQDGVYVRLGCGHRIRRLEPLHADASLRADERRRDAEVDRQTLPHRQRQRVPHVEAVLQVPQTAGAPPRRQRRHEEEEGVPMPHLSRV